MYRLSTRRTARAAALELARGRRWRPACAPARSAQAEAGRRALGAQQPAELLALALPGSSLTATSSRKAARTAGCHRPRAHAHDDDPSGAFKAFEAGTGRPGGDLRPRHRARSPPRWPARCSTRRRSAAAPASLDVGCGPGTVAAAAAARGARPDGVDLARPWWRSPARGTPGSRSRSATRKRCRRATAPTARWSPASSSTTSRSPERALAEGPGPRAGRPSRPRAVGARGRQPAAGRALPRRWRSRASTCARAPRGSGPLPPGRRGADAPRARGGAGSPACGRARCASCTA